MISHLLNNKRDSQEQIFDFATQSVADSAARFHASLPNYAPTPLVELGALAKKLNIQQLMIKDESFRFGLNAFKVLGASYAFAKYLGEYLGISDSRLTFENLRRRQSEYQHITFVTATDGNHGRAVAWIASQLGCQSVVFLPKGSAIARLKAIQNAGAEATITDLNYDDTVLHAKKMANKRDWVLLQDTAWPGYEQVPEHIMQGYFTLMSETTQQAPNFWPTHVFMQAGVGSLAAGVLAYLHAVDNRPSPKYIVVEPEEAACVYHSMALNAGMPYTIAGDLPTIMAGLACGEPSHTGLKALSAQAFSFIHCDDELAKKGMRILASPLIGDTTIISGESGAVTLGVVYELLTNDHYQAICNDLEFSQDSKVLLVSTEGDTDPEFYRKVIEGEGNT